MKVGFRCLFATTALCLVLAGPSTAQEVAVPPAAAAAETPAPTTVPVRALGSDSAPVRIDLYSAFNCVECADWYLTVLPELTSRYIDTGEARLVFHDVAVEPIQPSVRAAMIGLCADPARFFDVARSLMSGQAAVVEDESRVTQWYADAITAAGGDRAEVEACAASEAAYNMVVEQNADPFAGAFPAFPGVAVNGRVVEHPTLQGVAAAILSASMAPRE